MQKQLKMHLQETSLSSFPTTHTSKIALNLNNHPTPKIKYTNRIFHNSEQKLSENEEDKAREKLRKIPKNRDQYKKSQPKKTSKPKSFKKDPRKTSIDSNTIKISA